MDLTEGYKTAIPATIQDRYDFLETRNAAAVLAATDPSALANLTSVLDEFVLLESDILTAGGQETDIAARLNTEFRELGWREARVDTTTRLTLVLRPHRPAGETEATTADTEVTNEGYQVDNVIRRVALDVEWNAKDGNLDRDLAAYRALYDWGLIDAAVIVTRTHYDLRDFGRAVATWRGDNVAASRFLGTTTTTNSAKLQPRMTRGDSGGCPLLAVLICPRTYADPRPPGY